MLLYYIIIQGKKEEGIFEPIITQLKFDGISPLNIVGPKPYNIQLGE